jgi:hypothetical protein
MDNVKHRTNQAVLEKAAGLWRSQTVSEPYQNWQHFRRPAAFRKKAESRTPYQNRIKTPSVEAVELAD